MSDNPSDSWASFKEGVLKACDEVCGYKNNMRHNVNTRWWNNGAKGEIQKKKEAYKEMTQKNTEETKNEYRRRLKTAAKKAVARAMEEEAVRKIIETGQ